MQDEFTHNFIKPFKYAKGGDEAEAGCITVHAPTNRLLKQVSIIEKEYRKSELKLVEAFKNVIGDSGFQKIIEGKQETQEITPDAAISSMMSGGAKMDDCYGALKIILSGALVDDDTKMTATMFDDMRPCDTKEIMGKYIVNFLLTSPQT